jgi:cytochrome c-type biogenesis protein CcmF
MVLVLAMVLSAVGGALVLAGRRGVKEAGERFLLSAAAASAASLVILAVMFLNHDYRNAYVYEYADGNMGIGYLLCAVWGGQAGSLMFWAALQTFFTAAVVLIRKERPRFALGFLASLQTYFIALVLFHSNPFLTLGRLAVNGLGMNPLLLNPFMAVHPPTLFMGFVGFSVPTAFALQALLDKSFQQDWLNRERPWILFAWMFLTIGNLLGMVWAYEELGWGGYWGWDPVENASFMPWLVSTALVHIALIKKPSLGFGIHGPALSVLTFALILFGTFITRSGVIQSVHAFSDTTVGPYLLGLIVFLVVLCAVLIFVRRRDLVTDEGFGEILSKANLVRVTAWILLLSATFVWVGTMAPLFSELFRGEKVASTPEFFNRWMVPLGLTLFLTLGVCLVARRRKAKSDKHAFSAFATAIVIPGIFATVSAVLGTLVLGFQGPASLLAFLLLGFVAASVVRELFHILRKASAEKEKKGSSTKRIGAQIVHAAVVLLFLGFTGEAYTVEKSAVMNPGDVMSVGRYELTFEGLRDDTDYQKYAIYADLQVNADGKPYGTYSAARFYYHSHSEQPTNEVSIVRSLPEDLFLILGNIDEKTEAAAVRAVVNPLVSFIWAGGALLVIGTIVGLFGRANPESLSKDSHRLRMIGTGVGVGTAALFGSSFFFFEPIFPILSLIAALLLVTVITLGTAILSLTKGEAK